MDLTDQIIGAESGGNPDAANPNSSAMGSGQFLASTWNDLIRQYRPDLAEGKSPDQIAALRSDPDLSRAMVRAYAGQNATTLGNAGLDPTPGNLYLAHFAGPGGAISVLKADPGTPVSQILSPQAIAANPFLKGMTAGQLTQWAQGRLGGAQNAAPQQQPEGQPLSITPPPQASATPNGYGGMLNNGGLVGLASQLGAGNGMLNAANPQQTGAQQRPQMSVPQVSASPSPPPPLQLQIPQGTMASQIMRMRLLASILNPAGNQGAT